MTKILSIPEDEIVFLYKLLSQPEVDRGLMRFHGELRGQRRWPRYIIATTSAFGTGLTLSEAVTVCLLEPDYRLSAELQCFARHSRQGNKNKATFSWLLYAVGNSREDNIRKRNKARKLIDQTLEGKVHQVIDLS